MEASKNRGSTASSPAAAVSADERGFILIITMLTLVILTVLCIGAMDNSTFEVQIAANDRQSRVAFNLADGGVYATAKLINETINADGAVNYDPLLYDNIPDPETGANINNAADSFYRRVVGLDDPRTDGLYDFMYTTADGAVYARILDKWSATGGGGSAKFATGYYGGGKGSTASVGLVFEVEVDAFADRNAMTQLAARYRKVLGTPGGL